LYKTDTWLFSVVRNKVKLLALELWEQRCDIDRAIDPMGVKFHTGVTYRHDKK
jgi:hypothetical protein